MLIWIPFITYLIYNIILLALFGVPENLSSSFYLYKKYNLQWLFPATMIVLAGFLIPIWLNMTEGSPYQFISFLCPISIIFMAFAPNFENGDLEYKVHSIGAIFAALVALFAIIFVLKSYFVLIFIAILILLISIATKTLKKGLLYWIETIIFLSTFISLIYVG